MDLRLLDLVVALGLTVGAVIDARTVVGHDFGVAALWSCVLCTGAVGWRRPRPLLMAGLACTAYPVLVLVSGYDGGGTFEFAAIALIFYTLGRATERPADMIAAIVLFAYWLAGSVVVFYVPPGGTPGVVVSLWLCAVVPFAVGRTMVVRDELIDELASRTARLEDEQDLRARQAVVEERQRMARELHDVVAHCVSVMVVQASGARSVAGADPQAARRALEVVEGAGRDALVELRRMVGVLRRAGEPLAGPTPGLSGLDGLLERCRDAGLPVDLRVEGAAVELLPGLDLVAYRVVQEALTNAIKHAGPASARVVVAYGADALELTVSDTGRGDDQVPGGDGSGHGLVGMSERVAVFGGELHAGRRPGGGFEVRARIPIDGRAVSVTAPPPSPRPSPGQAWVPSPKRLRWPWLDPLLAAFALVVFEIGVLTSSSPRGPLVLNVAVAAALGFVTIWRRRLPVRYAVSTLALNWVMTHELTTLNSTALPKALLFIWPMYAVAAWTERRTAAAFLVLVLASIPVTLLLGRPGGNFAGYAGIVLIWLACWGTGRALRARRSLTAELERTSVRLAAEREARARLATAGERSRIARELNALVARSVAGMVIQTEAAGTQLELDPAEADSTMEAIESTGREALAELRRVLGVLRHQGPGPLAPQPGVDQVYALIERARERGQAIELTVDGDPGTLAAGVELGLYRILEEALLTASRWVSSAIGVSLRFGADDLELRLSASGDGPSQWPTDTIRERVASCGGEVHTDAPSENEWQLVARMPRGLQGALA
ncbi:MAG TPA: histidine kinase [Solirubrobacteraceae bacterium]|nr:histidine kinase [Solirubrobacteraceae bacterium]